MKPIVIVIADDLTGAAEMAGIGFRYGLRVELITKPVAASDADLLVLCTDSRSMPEEEAGRVTAKAVNSALSLQPRLLYKKIDSVLRGHVLLEIEIQMDLSGRHSALIIPANPSLGRTIRQGHYYINDQPVHETSFAKDPEFAIRDSSVVTMLKNGQHTVKVLSPEADIPAQGIFLGETASSAAIETWVIKRRENILLAGAGDFFTALLHRDYTEKHQLPLLPCKPFLYVSGTTFANSTAFIRYLDERLGCVAFLPANDESAWIKKAGEIVRKQNRLAIAFDDDKLANKKIAAASLRKIMAGAVKQVIESENIKEVFVEGGSTAAEILAELGITSLSPVEEWQRGVVRMKAGDMYITLKPGSYDLPQQLKTIFTEKLTIHHC